MIQKGFFFALIIQIVDRAQFRGGRVKFLSQPLKKTLQKSVSGRWLASLPLKGGPYPIAPEEVRQNMGQQPFYFLGIILAPYSHQQNGSPEFGNFVRKGQCVRNKLLPPVNHRIQHSVVRQIKVGEGGFLLQILQRLYRGLETIE